MGNTDKNESKKCRRKIRIRLADPNIPDSYVCEIFDSSLENEEEISKSNETLSKEKEGLEKPRNYFEILMSKKCKKNGRTDSGIESEAFRVNGGEESFKKKGQVSERGKKSLDQIRREEQDHETDSSSDECLLEIQRKSASKKHETTEDNQFCIDLTNEKIANEKINLNNEVFTVFDSPKQDSPQEKKLGILNYFSKSDNCLRNKVILEKDGEINTAMKSLKTCQSNNCLKPIKKQESIKNRQTEKKILINGINKENVKLAPVFCKKVNKVIDSDRQKARLDFLYRGSPMTVKKTENKTPENILNFPVVPHVQQRNDSVCWSRREIRLPLPEVQHSEELTLNSTKKFTLDISNSNIVNNTVANNSIEINKEFLQNTKCKYLELNLESVIDGLKEKRDRFLKRSHEIDKSKNQSYEELNTLWTEKYKPKSNEILGNGNVVKKLKKWLQSWKSFDEELKILAKTNRSLKNKKESDDDDDDSSDDFLDFGNENYGLKTPGNVCVISGPNGCGKTALVHALAGELEFGVLELNASAKRPGKKVLTDLQEATQSHKVQRVNLQTDFFQKGGKKKKNKKKKKSKKESGKGLGQTNDCKISLILIEDADIVFEEHDEGFFSAIASLVQTSKRPLIFLSNDPNCQNLYNFKSDQCLILEMELPSFYNSCAVLDVVSSLEGATFDREILETLLRQNNFDLRRSLHQLQFWIHSGKNPTAFYKQFDLGQLWWGLSKFLYSRDMKHTVKVKTRKRKRGSDLFDSSDEETETTNKKFKSESDSSTFRPSLKTEPVSRKFDPAIVSCFRVLDLASVADGFCPPGSSEPIPWLECRAKDSLSLGENMEETSWARENFARQISDELVGLSSRIFRRNLKNDDRKLDCAAPCWEEIRWRNSREKASDELSVLVSQHRGRDRRSLHLDYLPVLRNICRTERNRSEMNPKRKNRFFHYLNNLGLELTEENSEINCDVFDG